MNVCRWLVVAFLSVVGPGCSTGAAGANLSGNFFISTPFTTIFSTTSLCPATLYPKLSFILATFLLPPLAIECFRTQPLT